MEHLIGEAATHESNRRTAKARRRRYQTTVIKRILRDLGLEHVGAKPTVRTRKNHAGEYIDYEIHTDSLTDAQCAALKEQGFEVENYRQDGFAILYHCGGL